MGEEEPGRGDADFRLTVNVPVPAAFEGPAAMAVGFDHLFREGLTGLSTPANKAPLSFANAAFLALFSSLSRSASSLSSFCLFPSLRTLFHPLDCDCPARASASASAPAARPRGESLKAWNSPAPGDKAGSFPFPILPTSDARVDGPPVGDRIGNGSGSSLSSLSSSLRVDENHRLPPLLPLRVRSLLFRGLGESDRSDALESFRSFSERRFVTGIIGGRRGTCSTG